MAPKPQVSARRPISQPFFASRLTLSADLANFVAATAKHGKQVLLWPGADVHGRPPSAMRIELSFERDKVRAIFCVDD